MERDVCTQWSMGVRRIFFLHHSLDSVNLIGLVNPFFQETIPTLKRLQAPPPPPVSNECHVQQTLPFRPYLIWHLIRYRVSKPMFQAKGLGK